MNQLKQKQTEWITGQSVSLDFLSEKPPASLHRKVPQVKFKNLHGKQINLIKLNQNVLSDLHEYSMNPLVYQYLEFPPFTNITETKEYLLKLINRSKSGNAQYWSINSIKHQKVIGTIGVHDID